MSGGLEAREGTRERVKGGARGKREVSAKYHSLMAAGDARVAGIKKERLLLGL